MKLFPAEIDLHPDGSYLGGVVVQVPSGRMLQVAWRTRDPIQPTIDGAKAYTAELLDTLIKRKLIDDAERTNWPSVVAAMQKVLTDFNARVRLGAQ